MRVWLAATLLISGCSAQDDQQERLNLEQSKAELQNLIETEARLRDDLERRQAKPEASAPQMVEAVPGIEPIPTKEADLCWQDYCPCVGDQRGAEKFLCRQLKAGIPVDPEIMSVAAGARDARAQLDDFEAENGKF